MAVTHEQIELGLVLLARLVEAQERIAKATEEQAYSVDCMTGHIDNIEGNTRRISNGNT